MTIDYEKVITGIDQIKSSVTSLKSQLDKIGNNTGIPKLNKQIQKSSGLSKTLKGIAGIGTAVVTGRKMIRILQGMTDESVNFVETSNLFSVSMGKGLQGLNQYYEKAVRFQNELQEKLGVNIEESMNYQALFNSMSKSMGISAKYSYMLSENLTKLGYDLASLYNIDPENAMQKLRAGLAGQTKPLRDLGLDITQQSLQPIVDELGINRSIKNMSQAEKMVLRYIAVLKQAQIAHGDFANTMESPANQLRIFNAQVVAFKRNMGNLWQGFLGGILPYVNAVMMVINEILKMVAKLFGFKVSDQKVNLSANIGADDLASDLGTASGKAKELKNQLMGFDEINNISLPSSSGGGSGGVSGGGIDQRLLDAMKEYDNLMDKVKGKATDIRDKIMQWLGFTKKINPLTGEINWEYTGMSKQAKIILGILKGIIALYLGAKILKFIGWLNTLRKVLLGTQVATTNFQAGLALLGQGFKTTVTAGKTLITNFKYYRALGASTGQAFSEASKDMLKLVPTSVKVAGGIAGLVGSNALAYKSMKDLSEGSISAGEAMVKLSGGIAGAAASGALLGSVIPGVGTAVGAIAGGFSAIIVSMLGYETENDKLVNSINKSNEAIAEHITQWEEQKRIVQESVDIQLAEIGYTESLVSELDNLVDANGKVKDGYEERVKFILNQLNEAYGTEYDLINGEIKNYKELKDSIYKVIDAKKAEILLEANQALYAKAIETRTQAYQDYKTAINNTEIAQNALTDSLEMYGLTLDDYITKSNKYESVMNRFNVSFKKLGETYDEAKQKSNESAKVWTENNQIIMNWEDLKTATVIGDEEEIEKKITQMTNTYETESGKQTQTLKEKLQMEKDATEKFGRDTYSTVIKYLKDTTVSVKELSQEQIEAWKYLAENDKTAFNEAIKDLPEDVRKKIEKITGNIISETNKAIPEVETASSNISKIITKNMDGTFSINFGLNANYSELKNKLISMRDTISKMSNVPLVGSAFVKYKDNIQSLINQLSVNGYEGGGFPVSGEMFLARENGLPEMVGKIGNKTSVANNGQIIEGIKAGVYEAVMSANSQNGGTRVSLDVRADEGIIVKKATQGIRDFVEQTGELPFPVPV